MGEKGEPIMKEILVVAASIVVLATAMSFVASSGFDYKTPQHWIILVCIILYTMLQIHASHM